jgi:hypothetical protein
LVEILKLVVAESGSLLDWYEISNRGFLLEWYLQVLVVVILLIVVEI